MPIVGKTTRNDLIELPPRYPVVARWRLGDEKGENRPGKNLDHFRIDWEADTETEQLVFERLFGTDPIRQMDIVVLGNTIEACFNSYYRLYGTNKTKRKCDGCTIVHSLVSSEIGEPCMCDPDIRDNGSKSQKAKAGVCGADGYFFFTIPQYCAVLGEMVQFMMSTTSLENLQEIGKALVEAETIRGALKFSPFNLSRYSKDFTLSDGEGGAMNVTQWMVRLKPIFGEDVEQRILGIAAPAALPESSTPQLAAASDIVEGEIADNELNAESKQVAESEREQLIADVHEWIDKRFDLDEEQFLFLMGSFTSVEQLVDEFKDRQTLENQIIQEMCIKRGHLVKIYGVRTMQHRNTVKMAIPFGFGMIFSYTREDFGDWSEVARRGYGETVDGQYPHNIATVGDHAFAQVFALPYMSMKLGLTDTGNLKIVRITGDIPF